MSRATTRAVFRAHRGAVDMFRLMAEALDLALKRESSVLPCGKPSGGESAVGFRGLPGRFAAATGGSLGAADAE